MRKKLFSRGSLSLSINAIVILILAMSMLGLGIAFTKNMFGKFATKIDVPPPPIDATALEPVVVQSQIEFRHGKEFSFGVNFYNDFDDGVIHPSLQCFKNLKARSSPAGEYLGGGVATEHIIGDERFGGCSVEAGNQQNELKGDCSVVAAPKRISAGDQATFQFIIPKKATGVTHVGQDVCEIAFCVTEQWGLSSDGLSYQCPTDGSISEQIVITVT